MGAFSKEFWITLAASIPIIAWVLIIGQTRGQSVTVAVFQSVVLVVGITVIWREGERISEAVTKIWERIDPTRVWDPEFVRADGNSKNTSAENHASTQTLSQLGEEPNSLGLRAIGGDGKVFCRFCGYSISSQAHFCRRCGRAQPVVG